MHLQIFIDLQQKFFVTANRKWTLDYYPIHTIIPASQGHKRALFKTE